VITGVANETAMPVAAAPTVADARTALAFSRLACIDSFNAAGAAASRNHGTGLVIAGLEVPHLHVHVFPAWTLDDFSIAQVKPASDDELDQSAARLRAVLEHPGQPPDSPAAPTLS
jgi:hypothetical protein